MESSNDKIILIDADIVSHFVIAQEWEMLDNIFPHKLFALEQVKKELDNFRRHRPEIDTIFMRGIVKEMPFPQENEEIKKEYLWIKKMRFRGDGESACMAVARYNKNILASSNLKDIGEYCKMHSIIYITTMDFLCRALQEDIFDEARCDEFIRKVLERGNKLPVKKMKEHTCRSIDL